MDVSAQTLREVQFREKLRGYHPDDVDEFLERVAAGLDYLQDRLRQAVERAQRAEQRVAESSDGDDALRRTLVLAQRTAELAVQEAREEAERISASARAEARAIVTQAEDVARRAIEESQGGLRTEVGQLEAARDQLRADIAALERHVDEERARLRASLTGALQAVDDHLAPPRPAPTFHEVDVPAVRVPSVTLPSGPPPVDLVDPVDPADAREPARPADVDEPAFARPSEPVTAAWSPFAPEADDDVAERTEARAEHEDRAPAPEPERAPMGATASSGPSIDDDPFIAELRRAITDTEPLGPREDDDEGAPGMPAGSDELRDGDLLDAGRLGSLLRRRR